VAASAIEELLLAVRCRPAIAALAVGRAAAMHGERLRAKGPTSARWELAPTHQGLERAGLVVVNVRTHTRRSRCGGAVSFNVHSSNSIDASAGTRSRVAP
jgi:hypothetical protein